MKSNVFFRPCTADEISAIVDFLMEIGPELYLSERSVAEEMVALLFAQGGVVAGFARRDDGKRMVAMVGYFWGDPHNDFAGKETGFVYVAAIARRYRHTSAFRGLMAAGARVFVARGAKEVRFHAEETNAYTNMLYSKFAQPIKKEKNRRGITCILYGNTVANVIAYLPQDPSRRREQTPD
jgi:hypothetical protein